MSTQAKAATQTVNVTVDAREFYSVGRMLRRGSGRRSLGEVTFSARDGKLSIQAREGGANLPCQPCQPITARVSNLNFRRLFDLREAPEESAPLMVIFRPSRHEIVINGVGVHARFDPCPPRGPESRTAPCSVKPSSL